METHPQKRLDQFAVRLPVGLREKIKESADQNLRSMNAEIVFHLQRAVGEKETNEKADATA